MCNFPLFFRKITTVKSYFRCCKFYYHTCDYNWFIVVLCINFMVREIVKFKSFCWQTFLSGYTISFPFFFINFTLRNNVFFLVSSLLCCICLWKWGREFRKCQRFYFHTKLCVIVNKASYFWLSASKIEWMAF